MLADGFGREEKERKTEAEVDKQCKCGLEGEGPFGDETQNQAVWRKLIRKSNPHAVDNKKTMEGR